MLRCQVEEMAGRFGTKVVQRVQQADQAALEHVQGFGPRADVGEIAQHQPRQPLHSGATGAQQFVGGVTVASLPALDAALQPQGVQQGIVHVSIRSQARAQEKRPLYRAAPPRQALANCCPVCARRLVRSFGSKRRRPPTPNKNP
jgi:hypothetical protein